MGDMVEAKDAQQGDRLVTDYSGVQTVAEAQEVSVLASDNAIEIRYESGLVQYHGPTEMLKRVSV